MTADSPSDREETKRDRLAVQRTVLANERTLLAYSRTAIMLGASGATLLKLYSDETLPLITGWLLVTAGIGVAILGTSRFRKLARTLD